VDLTENKPALSLTTSTGLLTGSVVDSLTGKLISVKLVVLQNQQVAAGFFLGSSQSGKVILSPAP
jgi:hypothetical protein